MEVFNLKKNEIGLQGVKSLEDCLSLSKTIKELNLNGNNMGDTYHPATKTVNEGVINSTNNINYKLNTF